ncbi:hypothetical protein BuS5_02567 [Desulfosarcina sp. BuS5]|nr:hypothetical protein BuS5_02567 [Desulfosarcina sp. BuS5]
MESAKNRLIQNRIWGNDIEGKNIAEKKPWITFNRNDFFGNFYITVGLSG